MKASNIRDSKLYGHICNFLQCFYLQRSWPFWGVMYWRVKLGETILGKSPGAERWMRFLRLEAIFYVQFFHLFTKISKHFHSNLVLKYLVLSFWKITSHIFYSYAFSYPDVSHLYSTKTWSGNPVTTKRKKKELYSTGFLWLKTYFFIDVGIYIPIFLQKFSQKSPQQLSY